MIYTFLGKTGIQVSRICLGTMNFGELIDETKSHQIMDLAFEKGVNFFDTANIYGKNRGKGETERIIGNWIVNGNRRNEIVISTKVFGQMGEGPNSKGLSAYHIKKQCEDSLLRLKTDHIDLYQLHHVDRNTPIEETLQAMELLVNEGKVLYFGSSNFAAWHIARFQGIAEKRNFLGLVSEQSVYHLNNRYVEMEVIPMCRELGLGFLPWGPLASGLLTGILNKNFSTGKRSLDRIKNWSKTYRLQLEKYEILCKSLGKQTATVAIAWLLSNPVVTAPVVGISTKEQLKQAISSVNDSLNKETITELNNIWPGPKDESPEAYSW